MSLSAKRHLESCERAAVVVRESERLHQGDRFFTPCHVAISTSFLQGILASVQNDNWRKRHHNEVNVKRHPKANVKDL